MASTLLKKTGFQDVKVEWFEGLNAPRSEGLWPWALTTLALLSPTPSPLHPCTPSPLTLFAPFNPFASFAPSLPDPLALGIAAALSVVCCVLANAAFHCACIIGDQCSRNVFHSQWHYLPSSTAWFLRSLEPFHASNSEPQLYFVGDVVDVVVLLL